jgi:hypothetical protein
MPILASAGFVRFSTSGAEESLITVRKPETGKMYTGYDIVLFA